MSSFIRSLIYLCNKGEPAFGFKESKIHYNFINYFTLKLCKPTFKFSSIFFQIYRSSFLYLISFNFFPISKNSEK